MKGSRQVGWGVRSLVEWLSWRAAAVACAMALAVWLWLSLPAVAQTTPEIEALKEQQQQLDRQRQQLEQQRDQAEQQRDRLRQQQGQAEETRDRRDRDWQAARQRLERNRDRINAAVERLRDIERDLAVAEQTYDHSRQAAIARLRFLQRQSPQWGLAVLLQSESPNQLLDRRQQLERVYEADRQQLVALDAATSGLEIQRMRLRDRQRDLAAIARDLNVEESQLQVAAIAQSAIAAELAEQRQQAESEEARLAKDSATMAALIQAKAKQQTRLETAERARLARLEQERRARLQRERQERLARQRSRGGDRTGSSDYGGNKHAGPIGSGELAFPVFAPRTSGFGWRIHPILGRGRFHSGLDFGAPHGSTIRAAHGGRVIVAGWFGGYGKTVTIDRGDGLSTLYGHASELYVSEGDVVAAGQAIAAVGSTGLSTGPHLHFEVRRNGNPVDPSSFL